MAVTDYNANTNWANEEKYLTNLISQGGGVGQWATAQMQDLNAAKSKYAPVSVSSAVGNVQNALDLITGVSEKSSARSLDYAQQQQDWSAKQAQIANNFNALEAAKNREWQEYMSNTAHQREVADLKAAGLNPVLSASGGNGAVVTSGATANSVMPSGSRADSDTSANGAIVSLLGSMLAAQTSLTNQAVSARTQEAIADKTTAMSELVARIGAAASMSNAQTAASASKYGADMQYKIRQDFPDTLLQVLNSVLSDRGTSTGSVLSNALDSVMNLFSSSSDDWKQWADNKAEKDSHKAKSPKRK